MTSAEENAEELVARRVAIYGDPVDGFVRIAQVSSTPGIFRRHGETVVARRGGRVHALIRASEPKPAEVADNVPSGADEPKIAVGSYRAAVAGR